MVVIAIAGIILTGVVMEMKQGMDAQKNKDYIAFTSSLVKASALAKDSTGNYGQTAGFPAFSTAHIARIGLISDRYIDRTGVPFLVPPAGMGNATVARWGPAAAPLGFAITYTGLAREDCNTLLMTLGSTSFDIIDSNAIIVANSSTGVWNVAAACAISPAPANFLILYKYFQ